MPRGCFASSAAFEVFKNRYLQGILREVQGIKKTKKFCERGDSNPHRSPHYHLKVARLPIPPLPQWNARIIRGRFIGFKDSFIFALFCFRILLKGIGSYLLTKLENRSTALAIHSSGISIVCREENFFCWQHSCKTFTSS